MQTGTYMPVSKTTQGRASTRSNAPVRVAFRYANSVGTLKSMKLSRLNGWPAGANLSAPRTFPPHHCLVREPLSTPAFLRFQLGQTRDLSQVGNCYSLEILQPRCNKQRLDMTKTELQVALAAATETNKRTAGVFLDTLSTSPTKRSKRRANSSCPVLASW